MADDNTQNCKTAGHHPGQSFDREKPSTCFGFRHLKSYIKIS